MTEHIHEDILMIIIGDHAHTGELCHPIGASAETITPYNLFDETTYKMQLKNCPHGIRQCFVAKTQLKLISAPGLGYE